MFKNNVYINEPLRNGDNRVHDRVMPVCTSTLMPTKKQSICINSHAKSANVRRVSNKQLPQSIRLQIEVPIQMSGDESGDEIYTSNNNHTHNESSLTYVTDNYESVNEQSVTAITHTKAKKRNSINTIRFQISFDSSPHISSGKKPTKPQPPSSSSSSSFAKVKKSGSNSVASSGYFSSCSDYNNDTDTDTDTAAAAFFTNNQQNLSLNIENLHNSNKSCQKRRNSMNAFNNETMSSKISRASNRYDTINLYDKLDHASTATTKRRYSLSSDSSSSSSTGGTSNATSSSLSSSSSSLASVIVAQQQASNSFLDVENIYEDISNFCAKELHDPSMLDKEVYGKLNEFTSAPSVTNTSNGMITRSTRSSFRREYTVNEIFQNLKTFKEQASQFEKLYEHRQPSNNLQQEQPRSHKKSSVAALKQIFETSSTSMSASNASILKRIQKVKNLRSFKCDTQSAKMSPISTVNVQASVQHTYVNERISAPVNV
jgi:hypothetical protein